jgi:glyoxylase-like metal-dependent hydrolase (beta-lactamase superfamily II)
MPSKSVDADFLMRWSIGGVTVTRVLELPPLLADPARFIQTTREEISKHGWLSPEFADDAGNIKLNFQAFIVETGGARIMVDTCFGNDKPRTKTSFTMLNGPFLERLELAGYPPETIDYVLCTHLHADHCGWNTRLVDGKWLPTFPNAAYLLAKAEYECLRADKRGDAPAILQDSVQPVVDAGLVTLVESDHVIVEEVRLEPTPGHTPGHCAVIIASDGQEAVITGDALHHPVQVAIPDVGDNFCWDGEIAAATRRRLLHRVADRGALLLGSHFSGPVGIYLEPDGGAWKPVFRP